MALDPRQDMSALAIGRKLARVGAVFSVLILGVGSCAESPAPNPQPTPRQEMINVREISSGLNARIEIQQEVETRIARTEAEWATLWSELTRGSSPAPQRPTFDPGREAVLVVLARPPAVRITAALTRVDGNSTLNVRLARYPDSCASTAVVLYPFAVLALAPADLPRDSPLINHTTAICG